MEATSEASAVVVVVVFGPVMLSVDQLDFSFITISNDTTKVLIFSSLFFLYTNCRDEKHLRN